MRDEYPSGGRQAPNRIMLSELDRRTVLWSWHLQYSDLHVRVLSKPPTLTCTPPMTHTTKNPLRTP